MSAPFDESPEERAETRRGIRRRWLRVAAPLAGLAVVVFSETALRLLGAPDVVEIAVVAVVAGALVATATTVTRHLMAAWARSEREHRVRLEQLADLDELSGLHNYRYLREAMLAELEEATRTTTPLAVIMLDLNDFKDANDRLGHQAGDALIAAIGQAMCDEVSGRGTVVRYGGDEFTIVLPDTDRDGAEAIAARVTAAITRASTAATPQNHSMAVTASHGIAVYPEDGADAEALIAQADRALYAAKALAGELRVRSEEGHAQDVFFAIGEAMGRSLDAQELVQHLVNAVGVSLDLDSCSIWLAHEGGDIRVRSFYVADPELARRSAAVQQTRPLRWEEARARGMLADGPVYVDDIVMTEVFPEPLRALLDPGMWMMSVPLRAERDGMLLLIARHEQSAAPSVGVVEAVARLAAAALRNADTYARAREQAERLAGLAGIGGMLFGDGSLEERTGAAVRKIAEVTGFDSVTLDMADPAGRDAILRLFEGRAKDGGPVDGGLREMWMGIRPVLSDPSVAEFLATITQPVIMYDPVAEVGDLYRDVIIAGEIKMIVIMPVVWQGDLKVYSTSPATPSGASTRMTSR